MGLSLKLFTGKIMLAAFILTLSWFLSKTVNFSALIMGKKALMSPDKKDDQLILFFRDLLKVVIAIATLFILLRYVFERNISSLLTGLSIVGAALALAAKETIENLISSFIIFFDEPFGTGDLVKVGSINGTIEHIGLRSTRIRTADKTLITVPNKQMVDGQVDNWTRRIERRAECRLELSVQTSTSKLMAFQEKMKDTLSSNKQILRSSVYFSEISKSGKVLVVEYFTEPCSIDIFSQIKEEMNIVFSKSMEELNIDMAAGSQVTIISDAGGQASSSPSII
jgi:MscS family membrane protein